MENMISQPAGTHFDVTIEPYNITQVYLSGLEQRCCKSPSGRNCHTHYLYILCV